MIYNTSPKEKLKSHIYGISNDKHWVISSKNAIFAQEIIWNTNTVRGWILITSIWLLPKLENEFEKRGTTRISRSLIISTMNLWVFSVSLWKCELIAKDGISEWAEWDDNLFADIDKERKTIDQIFNHLKSDGHPVSHWYYGHFHRSWTSEIEGVLFSMLDIMEFKEVR